MAGFVCELEYRGKTLDLHDSIDYEVDARFPIPTTVINPSLAAGTSANRYRGPSKTGERAEPIALSFSVLVLGDSERQIGNNIRRIAGFLRNAGDDRYPLYLKVRGNKDISSESLWGQATASYRYQVIHGSVEVSDEWGTGARFGGWITVTITLLLKPGVRGARQRIGSATGGVFENYIGVGEGRSRGLSIPEATTNLHTNPIFGHATYNNEWTSDSGVISEKNTDKRYVVFGTLSVKITGVQATGNTYHQLITLAASSHTLSYIVIAPLREAISATQAQVFYNGSGRTSTYENLGNGFWRIYATVTGTGGAANAGILAQDGYTVFLCHAQAEAKAYKTTPCHGGLLGCAWSGTPHASSSSRAAGRYRVPLSQDKGSLIERSAFTTRIVWKTEYPNTHPNDLMLWDQDGGFYFQFVASSDVFTLGSPGGTISSAAQTYSIGDVMIFHLVGKPGTRRIYKNGISIASSTDFNPLDTVVSIQNLGSSDTDTLHANGTFLDFEIFDYGFSQTEVETDYANYLPWITGGDGLGQAVNPLPWAWTKDGDDVVDNGDDATRDNYLVIGGIPGDMPCDVEFSATSSAVAASNDFHFSMLTAPLDQFILPSFLTYNGAPDTVAVEVTDTTLATITLTTEQYKLLAGQDVRAMVRLNLGGTADNLSLQAGINPGGAYYYNDYISVDYPSTDEGYNLSRPISFLENKEFFDSQDLAQTFAFRVRAKRASSTDNVSLHSIHILPRPFLRFINISGSGITTPTILYAGNQAVEVSGSTQQYQYQLRGDPIEFQPGRYNILASFIGKPNVLSAITETLTYNSIYITPRWSVL